MADSITSYVTKFSPSGSGGSTHIGYHFDGKNNRRNQCVWWSSIILMGMTKNIGGLTHKNIRVRKEYELSKKHCLRCGGGIPFEKRKNKFCGSSCMATFTQRLGGHKQWTLDEKRALSVTIKNGYSSGRIPLATPRKERIKKVCGVCKREFEVLPSSGRRKFCSKACGNKMDRTGMGGGYRETSGRGKQGWYKGYHCQSSWELAWVIYALDHNIKFERNSQGFEYEFEGKTHKYYPDFKLEDGSYLEVKGWSWKKWESKLEAFPHKLTVLYKEELKSIFDYVHSTYGKDYTRLYE